MSSSTELSGALWRKSSYSNGQANCVEVAALADGQTSVSVRDSKAPDTFGLTFTARAWRQFTDRVSHAVPKPGLHHDLRRKLPAGSFVHARAASSLFLGAAEASTEEITSCAACGPRLG